MRLFYAVYVTKKCTQKKTLLIWDLIFFHSSPEQIIIIMNIQLVIFVILQICHRQFNNLADF